MTQLQDATYFASLVLWKYVPADPNLYTHHSVERGGTNSAVIDISFSCFGNLVTIGSSVDPEDKFADEEIFSVANVLNENGFVYMPEVYLYEKYSGNNPHFSESTWGERYFAYL